MQTSTLFCMFQILALSKCHILPKPSKFDTQLSQYLTTLNCNMDANYVTACLIDLTPNRCSNNLDNFAKNTRKPKIVKRTEKLSNSVTEYIVFLHDLTIIDETIEKLNTQSKTHVIICNPIVSSKIVKKISKTLWNKKILNFVIAYVTTRLKIITYDPYKREILKINPDECRRLFPNKLKNIRGHVLKVAMFDNPPITRETAPGKWRGKDAELLDLTIFALNATLEVVKSQISGFDGVKQLLIDNEAEFSFMGLVQGHDYGAFDTFNAHVKDGVVVLIPKSVKIVMTILEVFDREIWTYITLLTTFLAVLIRIAKKLNFRSLKILILMNLTISHVFLTIFQSSMSGTLTATRYEEIETIDDFMKTDLEIFVFPRIYGIVANVHDLAERMKVVDKGELYRMIMEGSTNKAFVLPYFVAKEFEKIVRNGEQIYSVIGEFLVPSHRVFLFRKNSPYLEEVESVVLQLKQAGLTHKIYTENHFEDEDANEKNFLTLKHFASVFGALAIGFSAAFFSFLLEIMKILTEMYKKFINMNKNN